MSESESEPTRGSESESELEPTRSSESESESGSGRRYQDFATLEFIITGTLTATSSYIGESAHFTHSAKLRTNVRKSLIPNL